MSYGKKILSYKEEILFDLNNLIAFESVPSNEKARKDALNFMLEKANTNFPWIKLIDGVELFFVLSGFLIGGIIIKEFQNNTAFGIKQIFHFWKRRWFRTLPNYYLILLLNVIIVYFGIIKEDFLQFNWKFFFFLQNFAHHFYGFFWESWSLSIEEWFYLLFPIILMLLYLLLIKFKINKKRFFY